MVVRRTATGKTLTSGAQVGIEKSMYLSLCRAHWEEETGRWPVAKPKAAKKKPSRKTHLKLAAANTPRPARRIKR